MERKANTPAETHPLSVAMDELIEQRRSETDPERARAAVMFGVLSAPAANNNTDPRQVSSRMRVAALIIRCGMH